MEPTATAIGYTYFIARSGAIIYKQKTIYPLDSITKKDMPTLALVARRKGQTTREYLADLCTPFLETGFSSHRDFIDQLSLQAQEQAKDCSIYFEIEMIIFYPAVTPQANNPIRSP